VSGTGTVPPELPGKTLSGAELQHKLARAAQVRAIVTLLSAAPIWFAWFASGGDRLGDAATALVFIGGPLLVTVLMTVLYCRSAVRCPHCGRSLWPCGTGNFKPRRMRLKESATACPGCGAGIV